jgi:hypothetical protein
LRRANYVVRYPHGVDIHYTAHRHGVPDADMAHAITHYLYAGDIDDDEAPPWRVLYLGPDRAGNLLEIVVLERDDGSELVIHAMKMTRQYESLLPQGGAQHGK